mmetsp:Transcript_19974/g.46860  ORF Transcript_19974/g.46860 Transcript_19974/m.46860 type:complete len:247 (-) Transcript_19974:189-929(-)
MRIPRFDGKRENFEEFMTKWNAYAIRKKFDLINKPEMHPEMPKDGRYTAGLTKRGRKLLYMNERAMAYLLTACLSSATCRCKISDSRTMRARDDPKDTRKQNAWPYGRIWLVLESLNSTFRQASIFDCIEPNRESDGIVLNPEVRRELAGIVLYPGEHPDRQFERMWRVRVKFLHKSCQPSMDQLIAYLIIGTREPYKHPYVMEATRLQSMEDKTVVVNSLREIGHHFWRYVDRIRVRSSERSCLV